MHAIETRDLTKYYGKVRGICRLDLRVKEGEIFGFIGPNGSGKTTTIRLLLSLLFPDSGSGEIFGHDIVKDGQNIKKIVGYVPSEVHYYEKMSVMELLAYSARFFGVSLDERFDQLVDLLDIDLHRKFSDLSMGNKKKVAVIQSLIHQPRLLILDEPTTGLDPLMQNHFFEFLKAENNRGTTIFFSSHVLGEVEKICSRVAIIKEGRIVKIHDIHTLKGKLIYRVKYRLKSGTGDMPLKIPGMIRKEKMGNEYSFLYQGQIPALMKELALLPIEKITISEPDLEEVFMHYYQDGNL